MSTKIPLIRPWFGKEEEKAIVGVLRTGWVMSGPKVAEFERNFGNIVGNTYCCATTSCTSALSLALRSIGVGYGDVVITVSHSFIATANAIRTVGAEPIFVDIESDTPNMSPLSLERCLTEEFDHSGNGLWFKNIDKLCVGESPISRCSEPRGRLAGILVVHQVGMPADMASIMALANRYNIPVVEDAACALGSEISMDSGKSWSLVGSPIGEAACFSFHPRKVISTGEGGMIAMQDSAKYEYILSSVQHGINLPPHLQSKPYDLSQGNYNHTSGNHRMTDIQAAIGIEQLKRLSEIVDRRRMLANKYISSLADIDGLKLPNEPSYARSNFQSFLVRLESPHKVKKVSEALKEKRIDTRPGIMCAHLEPAYWQAWPKGCLPQSEAAMENSLTLPLYPTMENYEIDRVINSLIGAIKN